MILVARCRCGLTSLSAFRKRAVPSTTDNPASSTTPTTTTYAEPVPKVRELRSGFHGATEWADFRIAERDYSPE